jgi:hypothetical protein
MSDVNTFIDAIGKDVNATVAPRIEGLAKGIGAKAVSDYVPQISAFASKLVKEIVDEQAVVVRDFARRCFSVISRSWPASCGPGS